MRQVPLAAGTQATGYDRAVRWPDEKAPGDPVNVALRVGSQLLPQLVGAQQQRNIAGVLEISLANDPRPSVAGSLVVGGLMPLQAEHPASSGRQMIGGRTSHTAQSHHDDVVTRSCADHIELPPDRAILGSTTGCRYTTSGLMLANRLRRHRHAASPSGGHRQSNRAGA